MSELSNTLKITPPGFFTGKNRGEMFMSKGHKCSYCGGSGYFSPVETGRDKYEENPCPVCKGSGKLTARIVIGWMPEEK